MDVRETLYNYIKNTFGIGEDPEFTEDAHLFDMGFIDSLAATEVILYIEKTWDIEITQRDLILYPMNTIDEIAIVIDGKLE